MQDQLKPSYIGLAGLGEAHAKFGLVPILQCMGRVMMEFEVVIGIPAAWQLSFVLAILVLSAMPASGRAR